MFAGARKLDNLVVIVDNNGLQIDGDIADVFIRNSTCDGDHRVIEVRLAKTWSLYRRRNYVNLL